MTTMEARGTNFRMIAAMDDDGEAMGNLYLDDGESLDEEWANHSKMEYVFAGNKLTSTPAKTDYVPEDDLRVDEIVLMGLSGPVSDISITGSSGGPCFFLNGDESYTVVTCENGFLVTSEWSLQVIF